MSLDLQAAYLCGQLYNCPQNFDAVSDNDGVYVGIKEYDDDVFIVFRGSTTIQDWFRDFEACPVTDIDLGRVECGFVQGLRSNFTRITKAHYLSDKNIVITGHSLGAARALLFGGLFAAYKIPCTIITFGSPRPATVHLTHLLAASPIRSYKNRRDPVTEVPLDIPVLAPYCHPRALLPLDIAPIMSDPWGVLADHHIELYTRGLALHCAP